MSPLRVTDDAIWGYVTARCWEMGFNPRDVRGPCREARFIAVRRAIAQELRLAPWELSYPHIGRALGNRDHSTIWVLLNGGRTKADRTEKQVWRASR